MMARDKNAAPRPKRFTREEQDAMRERAREAKSRKADGESDLLAQIAKMNASDRAMAQRLHAIVKANAPGLSSKTWYGMPAYEKDCQTICFFQSAAKFKSRYPLLGFSDKARLDEGDMWPTYFALNKLTPAVEASIVVLVNKAVRDKEEV